MIYKTARWVSLRKRILRRDKYLCQNCKRYGRRVEATTVHHIYPLSEYDEYKYCAWNLISLCSACHNKMHDRDSDRLTIEGMRLKEKTPRPKSDTKI